jgi:glycogen operon protein
MVYMGDECGRTQRGNNNAYCHDEPRNWLDWSLTGQDSGILRFHRRIAAFRAAQPSLRRAEFLTGKDSVGSGYPDISWHGVKAWKPDWTPQSRSLAFLLCGRHDKAAGGPANFLYAIFNMFHEPLDFELPVLPRGAAWSLAIDTARPEPDDIAAPGEEKPLGLPASLTVTERSIVVLIGK